MILAAIALIIALAQIVAPQSAAVPPASSTADVIAQLDAFETQWLATAQLQRIPDAAVEGLLRPGRITSDPHGRWTAQMLALAKLGHAAIPATRARVLESLGNTDPRIHVTVQPLITVLESMGPAAVPALVDIAQASSTSAVTMAALESIVRLEPRSEVFGQQLHPWWYWRPLDARSTELARALSPLLPRLRQIMERAATEWNPRQSPQPQRPAAYLLARWGAADLRARGLAVLRDLASAPNSFHDALEAIRLLHRLKAPGTADLIRAAVPRVPDYGNLKGSYQLLLAVALHQLGDRDYAPLLNAALQDHRADVRMDVAEFVARSGQIAHGRLLLPLLSDRVEWNRRTVAAVAHESLRRLTLAQVPPDAEAWQRWFDRHRGAERGRLLANWIASRRVSIARVPLDEADRAVRQLDARDGVAAFPLIDAYLERPDLDTSGIRGGGSSGPSGMDGPEIVSLLLAMVQHAVPGARERLEGCLTSSSAAVRIHAALALAAYDRERAIERLAIEVNQPDSGVGNAGVFLLQLGDPRGFPHRLKRLGSDHWATRQLACRDLRFYSQQTLSCDVKDGAPGRTANVAAWRGWWEREASTFRVRVREAELDLLAFPLISPISIGEREVK